MSTRSGTGSRTPPVADGRLARFGTDKLLYFTGDVIEAPETERGFRTKITVKVAQPIVVPFPGPAWRAALSAEEQVVELLRRAIGYRVRLR